MKKAAFLDRDGVIYRKAPEGLAANKLSAELNTKPDGGWLPQDATAQHSIDRGAIPRPKKSQLATWLSCRGWRCGRGGSGSAHHL